jgi:hypothetical protein
MAKYFRYFPKTIYSLNGSNSLDTVTNLTASFSFDESLTENSISYYQYTVPDGETPEIVANKFYGGPEKHWIILKMNNIFDVKTDWPIEQRILNEVIRSKYANNWITETIEMTDEEGNLFVAENGESLIYETGKDRDGLEWAILNNHSFYKIETRLFPVTGEKTVDKIQITEDDYNNLVEESANYTLSDGNTLTVSITKTRMSFYDYEVEQNDAKRDIKILKSDFVPTVDQEFVRVISNV